MSRMFLPVRALLCSLLLPLAACNTMSLPAERAQYQNSRSCCSRLAELPLATSGQPPYAFELNATTPHFDSGDGLAPAQLLRVDPTLHRHVEAAAMNRGASSLTDAGNDNYFRVAHLALKFYDRNFVELKSEVAGPNNIVVGATGQYSASWMAAIPAQAAFLLLTVNPKHIDQIYAGCVRPRDTSGLPQLDRCVRFPAGELRFEWKSWVYGKVLLAFHR